ncbi:dipeptidase [Oceanobacillus sp. FSL H7-0719]|uniref:dipeptidase n=1 Tax=Oceanobacillus sp. FSL H7-0719 TaxID=2954507 RepID=UPI00324EAB68
MNIIDTHCDALFKLQLGKRGKVFDHIPDFHDAPELQTNFSRLQAGGVKVQFFAIFILPDVPTNEQWQHALEQVDLFYTEVLGKNPAMKHIKNVEEIRELQSGEIGAVLTLEGADCIGNDLTKLKTLYRLGVLSVGLTWNPANLCADGAGEPRGGGLTVLGKDVVQLNNEHQILTDVSHLSERAFWDVIETAAYPFASHSNARRLCNHPRNLTDEQITALIEKDGALHVVFNPPFINEGSTDAKIADLIRHIDHICMLGGEKHIGFGSDFDGIENFIDGLENAAQYPNLINELLKHYPEETVKGFAFKNFMNHLPE